MKTTVWLIARLIEATHLKGEQVKYCNKLVYLMNLNIDDDSHWRN